MSDLAPQLRQHPIFAIAEASPLSELAERSQLRRLEDREVLYRVGDSADRVFVMASGLIRVFQTAPDGREVTITTLLPPNAFGEKTIIAESSGAPRRGYPENTMAMKPTELIEIPASAYLEFLSKSPSTAFELLRDICCRFTAAAFREVDVMLPVSVRLASLLLSYAEADGFPTPDGIKVRLPLTHEDLANGLGVAKKSISRTLREWSEAELIVRKKGWFILRQPAKLAELCGDSRLSHVYRYEPGSEDT